MGLAIRGQRDRFREQVLELEERLAAAEDDARAARRRQESLREESVRLYQKVKFLESVRGFSGRGALAAPSPILDSEEGEVEGEGEGGTESGLGGRRSGSSGAGLSDGPIGAAAARTGGSGGADDEAEAGGMGSSRGTRASAAGNQRAAQD